MRVVLDCDPGIDDAFALVYLTAAHHAGEIELDCVTTTAGNVDAVQCAQNAAWILTQCNLPAVPLAAGEAQPLELALTTTPETHGEYGLGYAHAPARHVASDWDMLWCDAIERGTEDLHLIVTGPLTNLATFARRYPRHFARLRHITVMGGAVNYPGNTTPTAEWNFWVDPHAAAEVFARTPVPITLCSLGVTEQLVLDPPRLERLVEALGDTPVAAVLSEITRFYFEFHEDVGEGYCAQLHDLLTVLIALGRIEVSALDATVDVEASSELMRGTVAADLRGMWEREPNARVVTAAAIERAWPLIDAACTLHARFTAGDADLKAAYHLKAEE